jgi:tetratricopeptide (TPR) repeat protein
MVCAQLRQKQRPTGGVELTGSAPDDRWWLRIVAKWHATSPAGHADPDFDAARAALLAGRLDEAWHGFESCAARRRRPHDHVGRGDVLLARGGLSLAADAYRLAIELDPADPMGWLGLLNAKLVAGEITSAIHDLELLVANRPDDHTCRVYLADAWYLAARQARDPTGDQRPAVTDPARAQVCRQAAHRILELRTDDAELDAAARRLLTEAGTAQTWTWQNGHLAAGLGALAAALGLGGAVVGGLTGNAPVIAVAAVLAALALLLIVLRFRQPAWRLPAHL